MPSDHIRRGYPSNRACQLCIEAVKWIPVLLIISIIAWSYYAYVIQLCFFTVESLIERLFYLVGYHICFFFFLWAYWQTIFTPSAKVPSKFRLPYSELEKLEAAENDARQRQILEGFALTLPVNNRTIQGMVRFCDKCQHLKPDRAHHCSVCGACVLKMDHHCPWVNNCVSFSNYKFFNLFLAYALLYCVFITLTTVQYFVRFWKGEFKGMGKFNIVFLFFVAVMFAVSLVSLFVYHCYLILHNRSTLEAFRAPVFASGADKNGFSLGAYNNFQEVFGDNRATWFLPIFTSRGDGVVFPVPPQHQPHYQSMGSTAPSLGDGVTFPQRAVDEDMNSLLHPWPEDSEFHPPPFSDQEYEMNSPRDFGDYPLPPLPSRSKNVKFATSLMDPSPV